MTSHCLIDKENSATDVVLPRSGHIVIGAPLPAGFDFDTLLKEVRQFYGDRFTLVHLPDAVRSDRTADNDANPVQAKAATRRRKAQ